MSADVELLWDGPPKCSAMVALAHGAGADMNSPFMELMAKGLAGHGYRVARFNFPYMTAKLKTGKGKPPDREPVLRATWLQAMMQTSLQCADLRALVVLSDSQLSKR